MSVDKAKFYREELDRSIADRESLQRQLSRVLEAEGMTEHDGLPDFVSRLHGVHERREEALREEIRAKDEAIAERDAEIERLNDDLVIALNHWPGGVHDDLWREICARTLKDFEGPQRRMAAEEADRDDE